LTEPEGERPRRWLTQYGRPVGPPDTFHDADEPPRPGPPPKRVRVVLAERRRARRVVRTLAEVEEQTGVGEMLVRDLIRSQFAAAIWLSIFLAITVGALPVLFYFLPELGEMTVLDIRLPWLVLGVGVNLLLIGIGWIYVKLTDRNEQSFMNIVED
jgi:hypothetical protein